LGSYSEVFVVVAGSDAKTLVEEVIETGFHTFA
jgi:hypothetical protein